MIPGTQRHRDRLLAERLLRSEERAYDELFEEQVPRLFRIALARLHGDQTAAEDAVQSTLAQGMRKLATYRGEASLLTWLATICLHEIGRQQRSQHRDRARTLDDEAPEIRAALDVLECPADDPEEQTRQSEVRRLVVATLDRLPARYAEALRSKYLDGLSVREIAARWNVEPTAVQSVLQRARAAFRDGFTAVTGVAATTGPLAPRRPDPGGSR
jgi:RNA polymerase sigma-70 factor (ECF subfamily)